MTGLAIGERPPSGAAVTGPVAPSRRRALWLALAQCSVFLVAWLIIVRLDYTPGTGLGLRMGEIGTALLVLVLLEPLRRRIPWLRIRSGSDRDRGFRLHILLGLLGPALILAHTRFTVHTQDGGLALVSLLLITLSGIAGRHLAAAMQHGLSGERASLSDLQRQAGLRGSQIHSRLVFAPEVQMLLRAFEQEALQTGGSPLFALFRSIWLGMLGRVVEARARRMLKFAVARQARFGLWDRGRQARRLHNGRNLIHSHVTSVLRVARFHRWMRLLSGWKLIHVPLVYLLVLATVAHVSSVHF